MHMLRFSSLRALAVVGITVALATPASAQYFGRNKVQYKKFDFQILRTEHFDIYFYPSEREGVDLAARMAERWYTRLSKFFDHELSNRQPLILYASHPDFEQTSAIAGDIGEGTGGVTESLRRRIVLPLAGPLGDTDHVIGHELVHAFQYDLMMGPGAPEGGAAAGARLPLWFIEGMAEYLTIGPVDPHTSMWLRDAARQEKLPDIRDLDNPRYFPYRWGQALWAYIGGRYGDNVVQQMLVTGINAGDIETTFEQTLGMTTKDVSQDWHDAIREQYGPVLDSTTPPGQLGRVVFRGDSGDMNVGPSISPDGKWIAFYSERGLLSIDLYLADATNGKIVRKLTSTATDPHYSSIQFIYSAGAWDRSSTRLAVATVTSGRPAIAIIEAATGKRQREIPVADVDEVFNPTWSPDGNSIAFTGLTRGLTDLFVYDLQNSSLRRLTNDPYADLTPAWSPDGRRIAFATDRFSTDLPTLKTGEYSLALIDPASGTIERLPVTSGGQHINPQWAPDSQSIYFVSDRDGIPNLYRTMVASGAVTQLTRVATGISGITSTSPALSVASANGTISVAVYQDGKYQIHFLDADTPGSEPSAPSPRAAALPPMNRRDSVVESANANATTGLPEATDEFETDEYKSKIGLEAIGSPTIAIGADRFGAAIGGGIGFQFGDVLGDQTLTVAVQLNAGLSRNYDVHNTAAQALYYNTKSRWNWGIVGGQIPYVSGGTQVGVGTVQGEPVQVEQTVIHRQTEQSVAGILAYPLNRAQRVEWQAGVSRVTFDQIVETFGVSLRTGARVIDDSTKTSLGDPLNLGTTSMALVYDTSNFGAVSPVSGQRYRFEAAPTFGSINFTSVLADYRRYFMPVSFYTIAGRAMSYGRFGSGAEDFRLSPLYLGYPSLVRGYETTSVGVQQCSVITVCSTFSRLVGSRIAVGNVEFRFPLLRPFGAPPSRMYGPMPVEVALFADAGVAWNQGQKPSFLGGERDGVSSAGVAFRANLGGWAIGEFDIARPFQALDNGWVFQFTLSPGW
jgi:Tol biopolymer transport system component